MSDNIENIFETTLNNCGSPVEGGHHLEVDTYDVLLVNEVSMYRMLIGCVNWLVTLGRFDLHFSVSTMGRYNYAPRKGHIGAMLIIFVYLKNHEKYRIIYDTSLLEDHREVDIDLNWSELYPDDVEDIPPDMPYPKGNHVRVTTFIDV